jgi:arsenite methyltransferase
MADMRRARKERPSLEGIIEAGDLGIEVLHPGGLEITEELAGLCGLGPGLRVLDVASGTGESACYIAERFGCDVTGIDLSEGLLERARDKAARRGVAAAFVKGDAHHIPFGDNSFDAVISECTLCLLDMEAALAEMVRVARPGGAVGAHDVCWREGAPEGLRRRLMELEGERPATLAGLKALFENAGLTGCIAVDKSGLFSDWTRRIRKELGVAGQGGIFIKVLKRWGLGGLLRILQAERIFRSPYMGYAIVVGRKP